MAKCHTVCNSIRGGSLYQHEEYVDMLFMTFMIFYEQFLLAYGCCVQDCGNDAYPEHLLSLSIFAFEVSLWLVFGIWV